MIAVISASTLGHGVSLQCDGKGASTEVHYSFDLQGSVANGIFVPKNSINTGDCPENVWYYPKGLNPSPSTGTGTGSGTTTTNQAATTPVASPTPFSAHIIINGKDCLDSFQYLMAGHSNCGVYQFTQKDGGFLIESSNGSGSIRIRCFLVMLQLRISNLI